ncbi:GTPase regulator associated with FAK [Rhodnius prolixus]|uniref:GTPase regulator associated with FAK n=1 Tax=Rhodnius prolixus TaxID=13249 RepID=UPI003D18CF14
MVIGLQPLEFTDCITDSPSFREKLHQHEKELDKTSQQIKRLVKEVKDLLNAAKNLSKAQRTLSDTLQNFSFECIGTSQTDDELVISKSLAEFGRLIGSIEDERDRMMERTHEQIIIPLERFRKEHIGGVKEGKKKFEKQTAKFCQSQERYLNLSTKKQDAAYLKEADATLDMEERHFFQASLQYVFLLQEVQERKKFEFVETLLSFMFGWLTFYHQGHEVAEDFKPYMKELQFRIQKTRENFNETRDKTESLMKKTLETKLRQTSPVESGGKVNSREGYLLLMEKKAFGAAWTKQYCTYHRDTKEFIMVPYNQMTGKSNTTERMILASCVRRMSDSIEKRFCFDLTSADRPGIIYTLQALSELDRQQWMDIMDGKEPTYSIPQPMKPAKTEEWQLDEVGMHFVNKCIEVLESRGLEEQGLYRVVGVSSKVAKLLSMGLDRRKYDKLNLDDTSEWESKTITSALKTYLRNLPEPLLTYRYHSSFISAAKQETLGERVSDVHTLVYRIPQQNISLLDMLIKHLTNVASHADKNLMTISNLGVCFGPTLLRPEEETVAAIMDIKFCNVVVEILIEHYAKIFKSPPQEQTEPSISTGVESMVIQPHPVPRSKYQNSTSSVSTASHVVVKPFIDSTVAAVPSSLTASLHSVTSSTTASSISTKDPNSTSTYHPPSGPLVNRSTRISGPVTAYSSENNLLTISTSVHPTCTPTYSSPHHLNHRLYSSTVFNAEPLNSTSSSNESVSSLSSRDLNNHPTPAKSHNPEFQISFRRLPYQNMRVRTLYACLGENDGELSFEPNQIITNVKNSLEPGWLEGTLNGKTGLVPENYVELLP